MTLSLSSSDLTLFGPALPEAFVQHELEGVLGKALPSAQDVESAWRALYRTLREPLANAGAIRIRNVVLNPLIAGLSYAEIVAADEVRTREGDESGGVMLKANGANLRAWSVAYEADLDAPTERGLNARYSPLRISERVLLTTGERVGLLTNGIELRLLLSDPARRASFASFSLSQWKLLRAYDPVPDAFRLLIALASPAGQKVLPEVLEQARLKQGQVTKDLRLQARRAIEAFVQSVLDHPANRDRVAQLVAEKGNEKLAKELWSEALVMVYRLLFILRGESGGRETPPFSFASHSLWRNTYSPSHAQPGNLAWVAQKVREEGMASGEFLEQGLRALFKAFEQGIKSNELNIAPLGGALFGAEVLPLLNGLRWGELGCAHLLDNLLRAPRGKGKQRSLARLSYRDLDVEELGRVYEALLELEPGITFDEMVRLRRAKLEVVVPRAQGEKYRTRTEDERPRTEDEESATDEDESEEESGEAENKKSKIEWIEEIAPGQFFLRVGLGRKSSGGHYTPESFVRFLVQETLGPICDQISPENDSQPYAILRLNVLDPSMGSAHFLIGADRFLGQRLYEASVRCAELGLWERIPAEIQPYLPGRRPEGESEAGFSAQRALALCKRLVAVHCLYGVDKNPLAVGLAKVALWLESFSEGLPLTFLDHRLVCGDSLLGPMNLLGDGPDSPMMPPYANTPIDQQLAQDVRARLQEHLGVALTKVRELDATVGIDPNDIAAKQQTKRELDAALKPFMDVCVAWSGGVMLGADKVDEAGYRAALELVARNEWVSEDAIRVALDALDSEKGDGAPLPANETALSIGFLRMLRKGREANVGVFPLAFPEVFFSTGDVNAMAGFDAVLGNPPWEQTEIGEQEFWSSYDLGILETTSQKVRSSIIKRLKSSLPRVSEIWDSYTALVDGDFRVTKAIYSYQVAEVDGKETVGRPDAFRLFSERCVQLAKDDGYVGLVLPSAFHANEGATGIRRLYLNKTQINHCYSFENKRKLFEIDSRFKFAVIVCKRDNDGTRSFRAGFYLHDDKLLFSEMQSDVHLLTYSREFVETTGGAHLTFVECRDPQDVQILTKCYEVAPHKFGDFADNYSIKLTQGFSLTRENDLLMPITQLSQMSLPVREGKTFFQYLDAWDTPIRYTTPLKRLIGKAHWLESVKYYRLAFRKVASATNERTVIFALLTPGSVFTDSVCCETTPQERINSNANLTAAVCNSFTFDWIARKKVGANVMFFLLRTLPFPNLDDNLRGFLTHSALRLTCNHVGYAPLWEEQLGSEWREPTPAHTFPVLASDDERWQVRAAIDAVVAQAYGLSREQYAHVLASFSHKSYPAAPTLCLQKFDELAAIGLDAFTRKYDPYWDVPLVETLPKPVIELPTLTQDTGEGRVAEERGKYAVKDLFGDTVPTNLFGEVVEKKKGRGRKK
jgi:hypothetical protein